MRERVAVTGIGVVTPIGWGYDAFGEALRAGRSGVRRIGAFDCTGMQTQIAAQVDDSTGDLLSWVEPRKAAKLMSRSALFAVAAAGMARRHAGLSRDAVDPERFGVVVGAGGMGATDLDLLMAQAQATMTELNPVLASAENILEGVILDSFLRKLMTTMVGRE